MSARQSSRVTGRRVPRLVGTWLLVVTALMVCGSATASADVVWRVASLSNSTVQPGGQLTYHLDLWNDGDTNTDGVSPIDLTVTLPAGMTAVSADTSAFSPGGSFDCPGVAGATGVIRCTGTPFFSANNNSIMTLTVDVGLGTPELLTTRFDLEGGGAPGVAHTADPVRVTSATPVFGIDAFDGAATKGGSPFTRAGGYPDELTTSIDFNTHTDPSPVIGDVWPVEDAKTVSVELPPGLVGNPTGLGECTQAQLANGEFTPTPLCPRTSQVGVAHVRHGLGEIGPVPVFNMVPPPGVPARFGFNVHGSIVVLDAHVRTGSDYGIGVTASNVPQGLAIAGNTVTLWGVPADPSHDAQRACGGQPRPCSSGTGRKAFFRNPTSCAAPGTVKATLAVDSWQHPGDFRTASFAAHAPLGYPFAAPDWGLPLGIDECEAVPFTPSLVAQPSVGATANSPSGFAFDVTIPQTDDPDLPAGQSDLRKVTVTLPEGLHVSPSSANSLQACTPDQIALRSATEPSCPNGSNLGSVTIDTPLLDVPVTGNLFLAKPFDNPFNSLVAVYLVASAKGVVIKLPGQTSLNQKTGQITAIFDNNPQLPFSRIHLELRGGPRAPLVTPKQCKTYTTHSELTGWNGRPAVSADSTFALSVDARGKACPSTFSPKFSAETDQSNGSTSSPFRMRFTREDEDQELSGLTVNLPRGLTGRIAKLDLCNDAQAKADACPAGARIGSVTVGAGAGTDPFYITNGRAYLTGPYKGAPFGASIVVPAVAGPFDLGNVTVRAAVFVDKHDATIRIVSDPLPTILQGIPLDVRDVRVSIDKPDFWLNPTGCDEKKITARLTSTQGATADVSERFQAVECGSLGLKPTMTMRIGGRGHTRRGQTSPFTTTLRMPQRRQMNLKSVRVTLPQTINARLNTINDACTRAEFESDVSKCTHAKAGSAVANTPLLRGPLKGTVYFVRNGHPIPDLFVALRGQVDFDLIGRISIPGGKRLATTFDAIPDVPIRSFTLKLLGGSRTASIGAAANLCSASSRSTVAWVDYIGQNGKVRSVDQALKVGGCPKQKKHKAKKTRRR